MINFPHWPTGDSTDEAPDWYKDCFRNALRRTAVILNQHERYPTCLKVSSTQLGKPETALASLFERKNWDASLIAIHRAEKDTHANDDEYQAEHFFYTDTQFPSAGDVRRASFTVPQPFLDWSYKRLHKPRSSESILQANEFREGVEDPEFISHCAANYLVKNFWHNFVHRHVQGIDNGNYHEFRGPAREDTDFDSDHIANLLLAKSYGQKLKLSGKIGNAASARLRAIFARNRCNLVFAERAKHRETDRSLMSDIERWNELEWRFCRSASNAISTELIASGLAPPSVRVFLGGEAKSGQRNGHTRYWRDGHVIVDVGGRRINTDAVAYIPDDELHTDEIAPERRSAITVRRAERLTEIITAVKLQYRKALREVSLADYVPKAFAALEARLSIPLVN